MQDVARDSPALWDLLSHNGLVWYGIWAVCQGDLGGVCGRYVADRPGWTWRWCSFLPPAKSLKDLLTQCARVQCLNKIIRLHMREKFYINTYVYRDVFYNVRVVMHYRGKNQEHLGIRRRLKHFARCKFNAWDFDHGDR